jgi:type I restriction enzyme S subunit
MALDDLDEKRADQKYLYYALLSRGFKDSITGTAQPQITRQSLSLVSVPLPPLPEQKRIAAILDKADSIRRKRQEAVRLTEELLRSVFLEMFGDPVINPKGWEEVAFADVCETRLGKMLDAKQQTGEHLRPYLRNSNVQWDRIETSDLEQMDFNEKDRKMFSLQDGDVLICEGGEVGRAAIWRNQLTECYFQKAIHRARPNQSIALPEYVMFWLWFMSKNGGFNDHVTSATIAHLTGEKLKEILMVLPPITMQRQFIKIYNLQAALKASINQYSVETNYLFNSTLQSVFKSDAQIHNH